MSGNGFNALRAAIMESRIRMLENFRLDAMEPYVIPTQAATQALRDALKRNGAWWIPAPLNAREQSELNSFFEENGVKFPSANLFEKGNADRDLSPYIMAWRVQRGDVLLTHNGFNQFSRKSPFLETVAQ